MLMFVLAISLCFLTAFVVYGVASLLDRKHDQKVAREKLSDRINNVMSV